MAVGHGLQIRRGALLVWGVAVLFVPLWFVNMRWIAADVRHGGLSSRLAEWVNQHVVPENEAPWSDPIRGLQVAGVAAAMLAIAELTVVAIVGVSVRGAARGVTLRIRKSSC